MAVREIVHAFLTAERPEEVYQFALDRVEPARRRDVRLRLSDRRGHRPHASRRGVQLAREVRQVPRPDARPPRLGPSGEAAGERRVIEVPDVFADHRSTTGTRSPTELGFRSFVALPLETATPSLGAVTFYFASPKRGERGDAHLMRMVADQMAATAEKARLIEDLQRANAELTRVERAARAAVR